MAIRKNTNPREQDLSPELRELLARNGMQAHIIVSGNTYRLAVQGHDSPLLTYDLTAKQMQALSDWGTNSANKKAYNTFTDIVGNDFYLPKDFVHARNANGRVAMGLHGYRVGAGEYGRDAHPDRLGWTPRQQEGFHLRRVGGQLFYAGAPMVAERADGRMKPGELQSGGYGFYYKGGSDGQSAGQTVQEQDVLQQLQTVIAPVAGRPRSQEPAKPYQELITSPVYFTNEKWQECLSSHGILIDADTKTLIVQSDSTQIDMRYDLDDEALQVLSSDDLDQVPIEQRLEVLNDIIKDDYTDKVTMEMLNSTERIAINLHPDVLQELEQQQVIEEVRPQMDLTDREQGQQATVSPDFQQREGAMVDGNDLSLLNEGKGWYREGSHGREVQVDEITVSPAEAEGKYRMTAVINGQAISHEISQRQYDKFLAVDDYHRMQLFSKIFKEVDMKTRPEAKVGFGTKLLAALTAGAVVTNELTHGRPAPELYGERFGGHAQPRVYYKPGVDSPGDVAARNFEAAMNADGRGAGVGRGL